MVRGGTIINIAGTTPVDDPEYRYKMPAVYGKIEGSGNGIKTAIPNISEVATSLHRNPGEVNKFFGTELGAQTRYNAETDRAIVNGAFTDGTLQDLIHRYIDKFVLCPTCGLPETEYKIKSGTIWHKCAACGSKEMVDMSHKLCNYILAEHKKDSKGKGKKEKDKKKKKDKDKDGSDDDKKKKKDKKKEKKSKKEKKPKAKDETTDKSYLEDAVFGKKKTDDDDLGLNSDEESVASEAGVDDEGALQLAVDATRKFLEANPNATDSEIVETVTNQQMASALKAHDKVVIMTRACITPQFFKNKEVPKYASAVSSITNGNRIMERRLIASLEAMSIEKPKSFPVLIKQFYDEDALEEETILEWADEGRTEYTLDVVDEDTRAILRGEAEPVIAWLQDDSEDDDSSDDE